MSAARSSSMVSKVLTHSRFSFKVRMKRSATPLPSGVNASLKFPENQRFEIVGFLALLGRILWFDPRREHSSIPTANSRSRRAQGLSRLAASSRPPEGLGLDWPEGAHHIIGKFKLLVLGEIHAAGDTDEDRSSVYDLMGLLTKARTAKEA